MILHLGDQVSVDSREIVAILAIPNQAVESTDALLAEAKQQNRLMTGDGQGTKAVVLCAGARRPGGVTENARVYLSPIAATTLAKRAGSGISALRMVATEMDQTDKEKA